MYRENLMIENESFKIITFSCAILNKILCILSAFNFDVEMLLSNMIHSFKKNAKMEKMLLS